MPDTPFRIEFLKKLHLFRGLSNEELAAVAEELREKTFTESEVVFAEGTVADSFFLIFEGRVDISRLVKNKPVKIGSLVKGDYFGEQGLLRGKNRNATITADQGTIVLFLYRVQFEQLLTKVQGLHHNFDIMMASRKLANELHFNWLAENEIIYFLARKHQFLLVRALVLPALILIPAFGLLASAYLLLSAAIGLVGGFLLIVDLAWAGWRYLDWGNDFYIVTNQRVVWLEKVIGLYDSRVEAGIGTILSVNTETGFWERVFDFGTVVVRTYTGQIRLDFVRHPKQAAAMIEEYQNRAKDVGRMADQETMKQAIRNKIEPPKPVPPPPPPPAPKKPAKKLFSLQAWWKNAFRMRTEDGSTITYHKHVFVFFRNASPYMAGFFIALSSFLIWPLVMGYIMPLWLVMLVLFGMFVLFFVVAYEYVDWKNDIYQVTVDQIIDVTRSPFGTEDRKAAPLENILSTEYKRRGFIGMALNFGSVTIMVGGAQYKFEDVVDPPSVQLDIVRRQQGRLAKKRETEIAGERDRMAEWLAMYHRTMAEIDREKNQSRPANPE